ncbi:MAG: glycosyltransferase [Spirochaetales bacterium]|nr:glycosyltransferase [Spirochaetales bacterium]
MASGSFLPKKVVFQTSGEYILILDADQIPHPGIIERTGGYFRDEKVAFVQPPSTSTTSRRGTPSVPTLPCSTAPYSRERTDGTPLSSAVPTPSCAGRPSCNWE